MNRACKRVLVTGGAGYVGSALVPALLAAGYSVRVLDLYLYGRDHFAKHRGPQLSEIVGDLRDATLRSRALSEVDAVIHLACISNDPSYDLDPELGRSINYDCFEPLVTEAKARGIQRFIYASSSSVYGIKEGEVNEERSLEPLTDYSKYKALCEDVLQRHGSTSFTTSIVRPSTVCGYASRLRLDLVVNILTNHGFHNGKIKVFGGRQLRPNIHIKDMVAAYLRLLEADTSVIDGQVFNVGYENHSVMKLAEIVRAQLTTPTEIEVTTSNDDRSYHVSSKKIHNLLGFQAQHTIADAVRDLCDAFRKGLVPEAMTSSRYYNIRRMQELSLS